MSANEEEKRLNEALAWFRREMRERREPGKHPSHLAAVVLLEAEKKFDLGTFGVEGWCDDVGSKGVSYLNTGDTYGLTILVHTTAAWWSARLGSWGDIAERQEAAHG